MSGEQERIGTVRDISLLELLYTGATKGRMPGWDLPISWSFFLPRD